MKFAGVTTSGWWQPSWQIVVFPEKGKDGRFTRLQRLPGMGVSRVYRVNSSIFNEEPSG